LSVTKFPSRPPNSSHQARGECRRNEVSHIRQIQTGGLNRHPEPPTRVKNLAKRLLDNSIIPCQYGVIPSDRRERGIPYETIANTLHPSRIFHNPKSLVGVSAILCRGMPHPSKRQLQILLIHPNPFLSPLGERMPTKLAGEGGSLSYHPSRRRSNPVPVCHSERPKGERNPL
jgi:hypothetical protein